MPPHFPVLAHIRRRPSSAFRDTTGRRGLAGRRDLAAVGRVRLYCCLLSFCLFTFSLLPSSLNALLFWYPFFFSGRKRRQLTTRLTIPFLGPEVFFNFFAWRIGMEKSLREGESAKNQPKVLQMRADGHQIQTAARRLSLMNWAVTAFAGPGDCRRLVAGRMWGQAQAWDPGF